MRLDFFKYQATGNDFVMIDSYNNPLELSENQIKFLCNRRFGVGADGLIFIEKSEKYDFKMKYHNSDGKIATMCGNGGRCVSMFAKKLGISSDIGGFEAADGYHSFKINDAIVELSMRKPESVNDYDPEKFIDTGSPHHVEIVKNIEEIDIMKDAQPIRHSDDYRRIGGTNVNFVEVNNVKSLSIRTFERGVEGETYSCGTGVVASAIILHKKELLKTNFIDISTKGGNLIVKFNENYSDIFLIGESKFVYKGLIEL